jgi:hypothetical protein
MVEFEEEKRSTYEQAMQVLDPNYNKKIDKP